jgi:hypothetical protein
VIAPVIARSNTASCPRHDAIKDTFMLDKIRGPIQRGNGRGQCCTINQHF